MKTRVDKMMEDVDVLTYRYSPSVVEILKITNIVLQRYLRDRKMTDEEKAELKKILKGIK